MTMRLSSDARQALARAGVSRRAFLKGSGALVVAFSSAGMMDGLSQVFAQGFNGTGSPQLDSWIAIGRDGIVTAYTGKCDFGQGLYTAQMQLVAEEVGVPLNRVRLVQCDTSMTPDQGTTSGQQSHPTNFNHSNLALAGATAREALVRLAAARLGAPAADLVASDGRVAVKANPSRNVAYGDLIGGQRFNLQLDQAAKRKHPSEWTVLGTRRSACRHARHGDGPIRVRAQRQSARHASWPCRAATRSRRDCRERRRELDPRASRHRQGGRQRQLRRRRRAETVAGDARCRAPQGDLDARHSAVAARRPVFSASQTARERHAARGLR